MSLKSCFCDLRHDTILLGMFIPNGVLLTHLIIEGIFFTQFFIQDVKCSDYCQGTYLETCEHGCCGTGCCYNKTLLALGLIFGLLLLLALCSGFVICFIQYWFRQKKKVTTRDAFTPTGDPTSGLFVKPSPLPPIFQIQKRIVQIQKRIGKQSKKKDEINLAIDDDSIEGESQKHNKTAQTKNDSNI